MPVPTRTVRPRGTLARARRPVAATCFAATVLVMLAGCPVKVAAVGVTVISALIVVALRIDSGPSVHRNPAPPAAVQIGQPDDDAAEVPR